MPKAAPCRPRRPTVDAPRHARGPGPVNRAGPAAPPPPPPPAGRQPSVSSNVTSFFLGTSYVDAEARSVPPTYRMVPLPSAV
jgi:hypothetical protein